MAYKISNLKVEQQDGAVGTLYATWTFGTTTTTTTSSSIKKGTVVKVKSGSKYYNGVDVPDFVEARQWIVLSVSGDRVVIDKDTTGTYSICSPINAKYLTVVSGGSSSGGSSTTTTKISNLDHFEVKWQYYTDGDVWFEGGTSQVKDGDLMSSSYTYPSNATIVKVKVKPVAKNKPSNKGTTTSIPYWTGEWVELSPPFRTYQGVPDRLNAPSVTVDKYKLTATVEGIEDSRVGIVKFYVVKNNETKPFTEGESHVVNQRAWFTCNLASGAKYRVKCKAVNVVTDKNKLEGEWSPFSNEVTTIPASVTNVKCVADSKTSVKVTWTGTEDATGYEVEYTTNKSYFDTTSGVQSLTIENTTAYVTGLSGDEFFFRVRARNTEGESGWSDIVSTAIGTKPSAPTTWTVTNTSTVGETTTLYWVHNSADGSYQTAAQIELDINGVIETISVFATTDEEEQEKAYSYVLNLSAYPEGAKVLWRVRTKGIIDEYSDWSIQRTIDIYAPPTAELKLNTDSTNGLLSMFPLNIEITANPKTQAPVAYHICLKSTENYETLNHAGETVIVSAGQEVYSKVFNTSDNPLSIDISAGDVVLMNNQMYLLEITVSMNSGLTSSATRYFTVNWGDDLYNPDASISIDNRTCAAYISPFCTDEGGNYIEDVVLSVYRREFDGGFVEIARDIVNNGAISVTDPHPALDYARYRIVARNKNTSEIGYSDLPGYPVNEHAIIIQWDESWNEFDYDESANAEFNAWNGSLLRLPYNIDITQRNNPDVTLVEYIGRKHPVGYYGTQRGENETWNTVIPSYDVETLYILRRLKNWAGNVYVREPSGTGYWAQVTVSWNIRHRELTIPITFDVKRVEGGL